jgi:hypothetical protein
LGAFYRELTEELCEAVRAATYLEEYVGSSKTRTYFDKAVEKEEKTGIPDPRIAALEVSPAAAPILDIFWEIKIGLTENGFSGSGRLGWRDIEAWCSLTNTEIRPWIARSLVHMDATRWLVLAERWSKGAEK